MSNSYLFTILFLVSLKLVKNLSYITFSRPLEFLVKYELHAQFRSYPYFQTANALNWDWITIALKSKQSKSNEWLISLCAF